MRKTAGTDMLSISRQPWKIIIPLWGGVIGISVILMLTQYFLPGNRLSLPAWLFYLPALLPAALIIVYSVLTRQAVWSAGTMDMFLLASLLFIPIPSVFVAYFSIFMIFRVLPALFRVRFFQNSNTLLISLFAGFMVVALISALLSRYPLQAFSSAGVFILYFIILIYFSASDNNLFRNSDWLQPLAWGLILWSGFAIIHFLLNQPLDISWGRKVIDTFSPRQHNYILISLFKFTSMTGWIFSFGILLLSSRLIQFYQETRLRDRLIYLAAILFSLAFIILSRGRAAFIILLAGWTVQILVNRKWLFAVGIAGLAALFLLIPNPKIQGTLRHLTNPRHIPNMQSRLDQYQAGKELRIKYSPVWGLGLMNFTKYYQEEYPEKYAFAPVDFIHGLYFSLLTETGWPGLILFLSFLISVAAGLLSRRSRDNRFRNTALSFFVALVSICWIDSVLYNVQVGILFWIFFSLGLNQQYQAGNSKEVTV